MFLLLQGCILDTGTVMLSSLVSSEPLCNPLSGCGCGNVYISAMYIIHHHFIKNQATRPINIHRRHTDRQIDSISKKSNKRCTIKHNKTHKNADGHTHRSNFTISLL